MQQYLVRRFDTATATAVVNETATTNALIFAAYVLMQSCACTGDGGDACDVGEAAEFSGTTEVLKRVSLAAVTALPTPNWRFAVIAVWREAPSCCLFI